MIRYSDSLDHISAENLQGGFFVGWFNPPSPANHLRILANSYCFQLAIAPTGDVIGYVTAVSDGISAAFIPQLEVLSAYQGQGIGAELMRRMLASLSHVYAIDLACEVDVQPFYEKVGMRRSTGMLYRNYRRQSCEPLSNPTS